MGFWEKYEALCVENGFKPSSEEMVDITGVSSAAIAGWKKGANPITKRKLRQIITTV